MLHDWFRSDAATDDGVVSAIGQAKKAADGKAVHLHGATVMQQGSRSAWSTRSACT